MEMELDSVDQNEQLKRYDVEFREVLRDSVLDAGGWRSLFVQVRDMLLPRYPGLDVCYHQHGQQHDLPWEMQGAQAHFGRRIAGVMWSALEEVKQDRESQGEGSEARYTSFTIEEIPSQPEPKQRRSLPAAELAKRLREVQPGQRIVLEYQAIADLRRDQVLLRKACQYAGWFDGVEKGYIPWRSRTRVDGKYALIVERPIKPFKRKTRKEE